ncbi:MAG TPA: thioesterase family protein [Clostridia bacterium]|nr:thioesterase family protein [Clostridia bacterium]
MVQKIHSEIIEPRVAETDMMGIVYHANYLIWCEVARTGLSSHLGYSYSDLSQAKVLWPVRRVSVDYRRPASYGERVYIKTKITRFSGVRLIYSYEFTNDKGILLARATTEHGITDENLRVVNLFKKDPKLASCLDAYLKVCQESENTCKKQ